jgi:hypothetical protein
VPVLAASHSHGGGVRRAWLATKAHDGRGKAMMHGYCFAHAGGYTAGTTDPADIRTLYSGGMALQSSLRLDAYGPFGALFS